MTDDVTGHDLVFHELNQAKEVGHDVSSFRSRFEELVAKDADNQAFIDLLGDIEELGVPTQIEASEPSDLNDILALLPEDTDRGYAGTSLDDKILGAWQGRVVGNMLGKPVEQGETWNRTYLESYLKSVGAFPLTDYIPVDQKDVDKYKFRENWEETTLGRVKGSSRDDDIDYTVLGLYLLEQHGWALTPQDVADEWLLRFPFHQVYTAERATYRNLVNGVPGDKAGGTNNPYREWIGALIRADIYGYVLPGKPRAAAKLSWQDAALSHRANGIYGEMWAAALVAAAFTAETPELAFIESLRHIPRQSRLSKELDAVYEDYKAGSSWDEALVNIEKETPVCTGSTRSTTLV